LDSLTVLDAIVLLGETRPTSLAGG
jgi:hypothetical protein